MQTITESRNETKAAAAPEPVFVLAAPHSLSSLLCAALGQHPEIYASPGLHLHGGAAVGESILAARHARPSHGNSFLRTIADLYAAEQTIESIEMARRWFRRRKDFPSEDVLLELREKIAPRTLVERCPIYADAAANLENMHTRFPGARYIYQVRHPFAQGKAVLSDLESVKKLMRDHRLAAQAKNAELDPQFPWFESQLAILEFLETIPKERQWHLRVEDLAADPASVLRDVCLWLGLAWNPEIRETMLAFENSPFFSPGPFNAPAGYDPSLRSLSPWRALPPEPPLDGALPWRKKAGLAPDTLELAQALGYGSAPAL